MFSSVSSQASRNSDTSDKPITTTAVKRGRFSVVTHTDDITPVMPQIPKSQVSEDGIPTTPSTPDNRFPTTPPLPDDRTPASPPVFNNGECSSSLVPYMKFLFCEMQADSSL